MSNYVNVDSPELENKRWLPHKDYQFAKSTLSAEIAASELALCAQDYPVFISQKGDQFTLLALFGMEKGNNAYINKRGNWLARYIPVEIRINPFSYRHNSNSELELVVNAHSRRVVSGTAGEAFVDNGGNLAPKLGKFQHSLQAIAASKVTSHKMCTLLQKHELLVPWASTESYRKTTEISEPLYAVNEPALAKLADDAVLELHKAGAMGFCYSLILSQLNMRAVDEFSQLHAEDKQDIGHTKNVEAIDLDSLL